MKTAGQAPLSPSEGQIPPVKCKTPFVWVTRRAQITGRPQAVLRLPGTSLHHRAQVPKAQEGQQERWAVNPPPSSPPRCTPSPRCAETDAAAPGPAQVGIRHGPSPDPTDGHRAPRGPPSRAPAPAPRGARQARGPAPPSSPALGAQGRLTARAPNHRRLPPRRQWLLCHPAGDTAGGRPLAAEASASRCETDVCPAQ